MKKAIYPGSFDPMTNGHMDILIRSLKIFDQVTVLVAGSSRKQSLLTTSERIELLRDSVAHLSGVKVDKTEGLIMEYAKANDAQAVVRGLRSPSDFEYEYMMASMNKNILPDIETVFMMTGQGLYFVSSSMIKELHAYGGDISAYVPAPVAKLLDNKRKAK
jgi:pantetheine-phosphate adenylyltransferase